MNTLSKIAKSNIASRLPGIACTAARILAVATLALLASATGAEAQSSAISLVQPRPLAGIHACATAEVREGAAWRTLLAARQLPEDEAKETLATLHDSLSREVDARPDDVELRYLLGVVAGSRADVEGGRTSIALGKEMLGHVEKVLQMDPRHAGAQHLVGRLHAAVLRMDGFTRFVATRLLGGGELGGASWEEARVRLEAAVAGAPCVPDHHYELARLYAERGDIRPAMEQLQDLLALADPEGPYADVHRKGRVLLARLEGSS